MNDESDEFMDLFLDGITYVAGGRTSSGFYTLEEQDYVCRLYRCIQIVQMFFPMLKSET